MGRENKNISRHFTILTSHPLLPRKLLKRNVPLEPSNKLIIRKKGDPGYLTLKRDWG